MILALIIGSGAAFGVIWTIKTKKLFPAIIVIGMIIGIVLVLDPTKATHLSGFYIYMSFAALGFIYGLLVKELKMGARVVICILTTSVIAYWLWRINHWHGNVLVAPILILITVVVAFIRKVELKNELGFLGIITADSVAMLAEHIIKMNGNI